MWSDGARGVLMAIIVAMLEDGFTPYLNFTREMFTITQVSNIVNRQGSKLMEWLKTRPLSSKVYDYAGSILDNPAEKTVAGYMSNLKTPLTRYLENGIEYIMSGTDLNFDDIIAKPTAIFILVPEEFPARSTIASMLIVQLYNELLHQSNDFAELNFALPRPFYFFWDEFGNSVKISELSSWITLCRSRNIFFTLYVQALSQITKLYGNDDTKTIVQNCHLQIIMGSNEDDTIEHFRKLFGERTIISRTANFDPKTSDIDFKGSSTLQKVDLVPSSFLRKIPTGDIYWKIHKQNPAHTHLVAIFEDGVKDILKIGVYDKPAELYHHYDRAKLIYDLDNRHALYQNQKQNEMLADMMEQPTENIQQTTEETQNSEQPTTNDNLSSENMLNVFDDDFIPDGWEIASPEQLGEYNSAQEKAAQEIIDSEEEVESRENGSKPLVPNNARRSVLGSRK
jgi:type IV secretion system protein VirD4